MNSRLIFIYKNRYQTSIGLEKPLLPAEWAGLKKAWQRGKRYTMVFDDGVSMSFDTKSVQQIQYEPGAPPMNITNAEERV